MFFRSTSECAHISPGAAPLASMDTGCLNHCPDILVLRPVVSGPSTCPSQHPHIRSAQLPPRPKSSTHSITSKRWRQMYQTYNFPLCAQSIWDTEASNEPPSLHSCSVHLSPERLNVLTLSFYVSSLPRYQNSSVYSVTFCGSPVQVRYTIQCWPNSSSLHPTRIPWSVKAFCQNCTILFCSSWL